jgi:hypothetical protein
MFKRFQVMDLFHGKEESKVVEWIATKDNVPDKIGIYKVKRNNGNECLAYFCPDQCIHLIKSSQLSPSYWWDKITKEPLYDVIEWGKNGMDRSFKN